MHQTEYDETVDYRLLYEEQLAWNTVLETKNNKLQAGKIGAGPFRLNNQAYEVLSSYQYRVKSLTFQLNAFRTGKKYLEMKDDIITQLTVKDREIMHLKAELANAHAETVTVRQYWSQVFDDIEKSYEKELSKKNTEILNLKKDNLELHKKLDEESDKRRAVLSELYQVRTALEDEQGKTQKLLAQMARDYENSSKPSSQSPNHAKITNNREKSGRRPGGQPGHVHHPRQRHVPTNIIEIPAPDEYMDNPEYVLTGKIVTKQLVDIHFEVSTTEFTTPEFRNVRTGERVHAEFPGGIKLDVNYSGNVKALAFLLNNHCNVSIDKVSELLSELTGGEINLSKGMINGLSKEFSVKTETDRKKMYADLQSAPMMNVDFTGVRVNGVNMSVLVCANLIDALFFAREHKGIEGVKGSPAEDYQGALGHDHDKTFYNYGSWHQECLEHILRYLKNSMENEPGLTWNARMRKLVQEMIHFWNGLDPEDDRDPDKIDPDSVAVFERHYDEILAKAQEEYDFEPANKYYKEGFNLFHRMLEYRDAHLLFLHNKYVSPTNNLSERLLRQVKRKLHQVMAFRSFGGLHYFCTALGSVLKMKTEEKNLYDSVAGVFASPVLTN
jgi:hypothetical protein